MCREGREGFWEQRCPRDLHVPGLVPAALRWATLPGCALWGYLEFSRMALGAGIGIWEQQGHPSQSIFADVPILVPIPLALLSPTSVTDLGWTLETIPVPLPWLLGAGWTWQDLELLPTGRGMAPARPLWDNLSLD